MTPKQMQQIEMLFEYAWYYKYLNPDALNFQWRFGRVHTLKQNYSLTQRIPVRITYKHQDVYLIQSAEDLVKAVKLVPNLREAAERLADNAKMVAKYYASHAQYAEFHKQTLIEYDRKARQALFEAMPETIAIDGETYTIEKEDGPARMNLTINGYRVDETDYGFGITALLISRYAQSYNTIDLPKVFFELREIINNLTQHGQA